MLAVHVFLCKGDIAVVSGDQADTIVQLEDVAVFTTHLPLVISHFELNTSGRPVTLSKPQSGDAYCPLSVLMQCLLMHGKAKGLGWLLLMVPLYPSNVYCPLSVVMQCLLMCGKAKVPWLASNGSPVSRQFFCQHLCRALQWAGLDPTYYKGHSFRIGAATPAVDRGTSDTQI